MNLRQLIRRALDACPPAVRRRYRLWREQFWASRRPRQTPFGFKFAAPRTTMTMGDYESSEIALFLKSLENVSVCIDIGAHVGLYSCLAASRGKQVLAIEPLAANLSLLYKNLLCNQFVDVEVYPLGLSSRPGIRRIYGASINASFVRGWAQASDARYSVVPVTTLDILAGSRFDGVQLFVKMDVEGFELEVLKGAESVLSMKPKPVWLVEIVLTEAIPGGINKQFQETFEMFWRHGYKARVADGDRRLVRAEDVERWVRMGSRDFGSYNYLFMQEG